MRFNEINIQETEEKQAELAQLEAKRDEMESALGKAREITRQIKYADTHMQIVTAIGSLADDLGIPESELDYYDRQVFDAKNRLESAIYEMEEVFEDRLRDLNNKVDDIQYDLDYPEG